MDISKKSIATLIDELITTDIKCWFAQERLMNADNDVDSGKAAKDAQRFNARRNALMRAIDKSLGQDDIALLEKSYG